MTSEGGRCHWGLAIRSLTPPPDAFLFLTFHTVSWLLLVCQAVPPQAST